mgnify:CR=1 FL=1
MNPILNFMAGAIVMGYAMAGLFFLKFWRQTRDQFFLALAPAFWLLGLGSALSRFSGVPVEARSHFYLFRVAAYGLILSAIWRKNRASNR